MLHCPRDRLTVNEAAQLADQLPMLVRGIYYEAWHPAGKPEKIRSRDEFLSRISAHFSRTRPINAEHAARAVFQVLQDHVSAGEIREVMEELPHEIRMLWPEPRQAWDRNASIYEVIRKHAARWQCVRNLRGGERSGRLKIVWRHVAKTGPGPRNDDRHNKRNLLLPAL